MLLIEEPFQGVVPDVLANVLEFFPAADNMVIVVVLPNRPPQFPGRQCLYGIDDLRDGRRARTPGQAISPLRGTPPITSPGSLLVLPQPEQQMDMIRHNNITVYSGILIDCRYSLDQFPRNFSCWSKPGDGLGNELLVGNWGVWLSLGDWPARGGRPYGGLCFSFAFYGTEDVFPSGPGGEGYQIIPRLGIIISP